MRLFRKTGYLVYSITTVMKDMSTFLLVFLVVILAFGFAFMSLQYICTPDADTDFEVCWLNGLSDGDPVPMKLGFVT